MRPGFKTELQYLLLSLIFLGFVGFNNGYLLVTLLAGVSGYLIWTLYRLQRLLRWLNSNAKDAPNSILGIVGILGDQIYRLQTRYERAKAAHRNQLKRITSLTNALSEGMIVLNENLELDWWNPSAASLLKLQEADRERPIHNLLRNPKFVAFLHQQDYDKPLELVSPYNPLQTLLFTGAKFEENNSVLIVTDISRLKHLEKVREDFVANLSHEIKTPLTVLIGYIETLQDNLADSNPAWEKALKQMAAQTERMNNLTADLITLSQLESKGSRASDKTEVPLYGLLTQITEDAKALGQDNYTVVLEPFDNHLSLKGDQKELYSAISNLVFNAIRHNPPGTSVSVSVIEQPNGGININVSDNGNGIDIKHIPRLTERFYRVDDSRNFSTGGTGLGLAIVKHVLARHHGRLEITSSLNKGSTFSCQFRQEA